MLRCTTPSPQDKAGSEPTVVPPIVLEETGLSLHNAVAPAQLSCADDCKKLRHKKRNGITLNNLIIDLANAICKQTYTANGFKKFSVSYLYSHGKVK
jgi:hypothetical protein